MPTAPPEPRTNSLAFAKTDCHTCTANQRRCDRKRPRCSSCSGKKIVCGGYSMQLTWPKRKSIQPSAATDDPFRLEPLSYHASIYARDPNSRSRPLKPRKFRFVAENAPSRKQTATESCQARVKPSSAYVNETQACASVQQSNFSKDRSIDQCTYGSPLLGTLDDGARGEMRHPMFILIMLICIE